MSIITEFVLVTELYTDFFNVCIDTMNNNKTQKLDFTEIPIIIAIPCQWKKC